MWTATERQGAGVLAYNIHTDPLQQNAQVREILKKRNEQGCHKSAVPLPHSSYSRQLHGTQAITHVRVHSTNFERNICQCQLSHNGLCVSSGCAPIPTVVVASSGASRCRKVVHDSGQGVQKLGGLHLCIAAASALNCANRMPHLLNASSTRRCVRPICQRDACEV